MTDKKLVENLVNDCLKDTELFLVGVKVSRNNVITVTIDSDSRVTIDDCTNLSRYIESKLDRDKEDFELTVTSFGLGEYFTLLRQYKKNIGQNVEVVTLEDGVFAGELKDVLSDKIILSVKRKKEDISINFEDIKHTRVVIQF